MIPSYTADEAKRRKWLKRLNSVEAATVREKKLRLELINMLTEQKSASNAICAFETRKRQLLSTHHGQGLSWTPHSGLFGWFLSFFIKNTAKGAALRQALADNADVKLNTIIQHTPTEPPSQDAFAEDLTDEAFENLMYENLNDALQNNSSRLKQLIKQSETNATQSNAVLERLNKAPMQLEPMTYFSLLTDLSKKASNTAEQSPTDPSLLAQLIEQNSTYIQDINTALERLYALRLQLEPLVYFNLLKNLSKIAPMQILVFLHQHSNNSDFVSSEYEFIELHTMAQLLMDHCVRRGNEINHHAYNTNYLLVLMNENYFDAFIKSLTTNSQTTLGNALDEFYSSKKENIVKNTQNRMTNATYITKQVQASLVNKNEIYLNTAGEILQRQLGLDIQNGQLTIPESTEDKQKKIAEQLKTRQIKLSPLEIDQLTTPFAVNFARLALEQLLFDLRFDYRPQKSTEALNTLCCLSNFINTWINQNPNNENRTLFLKVDPKYTCYFSSFKDLEEYWVPPLVFKLGQCGIDETKKTIFNFSKDRSLTPRQIDWIIERMRHYFPDDELIQALRDACLLAFSNENKTEVILATETIKQNLDQLKSDFSLTPESKSQDQQPSLLTHAQSKSTSSLVAYSLYANRNTSKALQEARLDPANEAVHVEETQATSLERA